MPGEQGCCSDDDAGGQPDRQRGDESGDRGRQEDGACRARASGGEDCAGEGGHEDGGGEHAAGGGDHDQCARRAAGLDAEDVYHAGEVELGERDRDCDGDAERGQRGGGDAVELVAFAITALQVTC